MKDNIMSANLVYNAAMRNVRTQTPRRDQDRQMAGSWDELINAGPFRGASEQAGLDFAAWRQCPGDFEPHYLAALERRYRRSA